jgi:hypothetical protein
MKKLNSKRLKKRGTEERWGWGTRTEKNSLLEKCTQDWI